MAMDYSRYPYYWGAISRFLRFYRADNHCEQCGAENHSINPKTGGRITLTVHHIGIDKPDGTKGDREDKRDCRLNNLIVLCNACHLLADQDLRVIHAQHTRREKRRRQQLQAGQQELQL